MKEKDNFKDLSTQLTVNNIKKEKLKHEANVNKYLNSKTEFFSLINQVQNKLSNVGLVKDAKDNINLLLELILSWRHKEYQKLPYKSIASIIAVLLYFVMPIDLIPDFLIGLGFIDDITMISFVIKQLQKEIDEFKTWKEKQSFVINNNNFEDNSYDE